MYNGSYSMGRRPQKGGAFVSAFGGMLWKEGRGVSRFHGAQCLAFSFPVPGFEPNWASEGTAGSSEGHGGDVALSARR